MKIQKVAITNFRTVKDDMFYLYPYMVFVGKNNAGKSNLMKALDVFFGRKPVFSDFRLEGKNRAKESTITVTFVNLTDEEKKLYNNKLLWKGTIREQLEITLTLIRDNKIEINYEYAQFQPDLSTSAAKNRYGFLYNKKLKSKKNFQEDPNVPTEFKQLIEDFISKKKSLGEGKSIRLSVEDFKNLKNLYIEKHPEIQKLKMKKVFIDAKIPKTKIENSLGNYYFIPAVQDIDDETTYKAKGSTNINQLMNYILDQMRDKDKEQEQNEKIRKIMKDIYQIENSSSELNKLSKNLNKTLEQFDGSKIRFDTELPNINRLVRDSLKIFMNDGVDTLVSEKGHGLQRYFMVSLFKVWAEILISKRQKDLVNSIKTNEKLISKKVITQKSKSKTRSICNSAYFAIEEPELFLHPQYQELMRNYLLEIAQTDNHQIILNTHSPNFIDFDDYKSVAIVVKSKVSGYDCSKVLQPVIEEKGKLKIQDIIHTHGYEREKFHKINKLNLSYFMNPNRSELFFADTVVLVEGETEKIMLQKWADYFFPNLIAKRATTTYIDCNGKFNMQLYQEMLNGFQISYVIIIDDDKGSRDKSMENLNYHIERIAKEGKGHFISLDIDFENEFEIIGHELSKYAKESKKFKPYQAFKKYFMDDGSPIVEELEKLRTHPKLKQIFFSIYQEDISKKQQ